MGYEWKTLLLFSVIPNPTPKGVGYEFFLDGKAVKQDSEDGVHPEKVFGFVVLV